MATDDNRTPLSMRFNKALLEEVDQRIKDVNARKARDGEPLISRTSWFENMTDWVIHQLPHQAVRSDLIKAWDTLPEEALDPRAFGRVGEKKEEE